LPARLTAAAAGPLAPFVKKLLAAPITPGARFVNNERVSDHHAIIPTEQAPDFKRLTSEERMLYDLIARRFVTVLFPPCLFEQITVTTRVNGEDFVTRGKTIKDPGWRVVTTKVAGDETQDKEDLPEQSLKQQTKGDQKTVKSVRLEKAQTNPPPRY